MHLSNVDVCLTTMVPNKFPWQNDLASYSWTRLINRDKFKSVKDRANRIYYFMLLANQVCPSVTWDGTILTMLYSNDARFPRSVKWEVTKDQTHFTTNLNDKLTKILVDENVLSLEVQSRTLSAFLDGDEVISMLEEL